MPMLIQDGKPINQVRHFLASHVCDAYKQCSMSEIEVGTGLCHRRVHKELRILEKLGEVDKLVGNNMVKYRLTELAYRR